MPMLERHFAQTCSLPLHWVWEILRLAGEVRDDDGTIIGIANTTVELGHIQAMTGLGAALCYTGPGVHDDQLTPDELFAWHRIDVAVRLEHMAEAPGRPRPGCIGVVVVLKSSISATHFSSDGSARHF